MGVARAIIAKNIRMMRNALGMTQVDLSVAAEIDRSYISGVEREKRSISADKVEQLAKTFGVEIYEMFHPHKRQAYQRDRKHVPGADDYTAFLGTDHGSGAPLVQLAIGLAHHLDSARLRLGVHAPQRRHHHT